MKNNKLVVVLASLSLIACGVEADDVDVSLSDSTETTGIDTLANQDLTFEMLEDYVTITNKTALYAQFGAENIKEDTSWYAEGTLMLMTSVLTNPVNGHIVKYVWQEDNQEALDIVEVHHVLYNDAYEQMGTQEVYSSTGLYVGMPINDLRKWNGAEFKFSGFGWDYGGGIFVKSGSKFADCNLRMTLDFDYDVEYPGMESLYGDMEFSSDDANVKGAVIRISKRVSKVNYYLILGLVCTIPYHAFMLVYPPRDYYRINLRQILLVVAQI